MNDVFIKTIGQYTTSILPWVVVGIGIAFFLENHINPKTIHKYLGSFGNKAIIGSVIMGMVSPLSIMSFLPVAHEFIDLGAHPGILFGFLVAERTYDFQSFFIISSLFGLKFAILNAVVIFISLYISIIALQDEQVHFSLEDGEAHNHFWLRQLKLLGIVLFGIIVSAWFRSYFPEYVFRQTMGTPLGGVMGAMGSGFILYLGPVIANYPIAKAFWELGMSRVGVFTFLTLSPVVNIIIISLFGGVAGYKITLKSFFIYTMVALIFSFLFILFPIL